MIPRPVKVDHEDSFDGSNYHHVTRSHSAMNFWQTQNKFRQFLAYLKTRFQPHKIAVPNEKQQEN
jgi:hypothetical protein